MLILKNTQTLIEPYQIEGVAMPFYSGSGEPQTLVRELETRKIRSVNPEAFVTVTEPPMFKSEAGPDPFEYPDYAVWCRHCHAFMGWASQLNLMAHCHECRNNTAFYHAIQADLELYVNVQKHHYAYTNEPSDDDYHDGMYNAHEQAMGRLEARWAKEGSLEIMERVALHFDLTPQDLARHFTKLAEPAPERELVGAAGRD
jgi:hypothetical protein